VNVRLSILKDGETLSSLVYEIKTSADWEKASADIWRRARQARPLAAPDINQFLSGLDDLWGATMKLDKA
jgi:hypothetical protein